MIMAVEPSATSPFLIPLSLTDMIDDEVLMARNWTLRAGQRVFKLGPLELWSICTLGDGPIYGQEKPAGVPTASSVLGGSSNRCLNPNDPPFAACLSPSTANSRKLTAIPGHALWIAFAITCP